MSNDAYYPYIDDPYPSSFPQSLSSSLKDGERNSDKSEKGRNGKENGAKTLEDLKDLGDMNIKMHSNEASVVVMMILYLNNSFVLEYATI
jgi:hypothetical protein